MSDTLAQNSENLAEGQQVFTACALIHHKFDGVEKVFLAKRAATKKFLPSVYEIPGGHVDYGEDMVAGLKREIQEEFGMHVIVGDPFAVFTYLNEVKRSHSIEVVYFATFADPLENITLHPEDHSAFGWFSKDDFYQAYTDHKGADDSEFKVVERAFELLNGSMLDFATE
ncbi:MAG: NUDIX hydrolase [Candidatus Saccharibacteria bacterium]